MARILVAEDDRHINRVVAMWLQRNGHEVVQAYDGSRALELMRELRPDLLVTDVNMPGLDGLDLLEAVRSESLLGHGAIVLTSRCDQMEIEARASRLGATVHPKPFSPLHLMEAIEAALQAECITTDQPPSGPGCVSR
jgi:serine/threonine-protein kinase PpkA